MTEESQGKLTKTGYYLQFLDNHHGYKALWQQQKIKVQVIIGRMQIIVKSPAFLILGSQYLPLESLFIMVITTNPWHSNVKILYNMLVQSDILKSILNSLWILQYTVNSNIAWILEV